MVTVSLCVRELGRCQPDTLFIDIAESHHFDIPLVGDVLLQEREMIRAPVTQANHCNVDAVVCPEDAPPSASSGEGRRHHSSPSQKTSAGNRVHCFCLVGCLGWSRANLHSYTSRVIPVRCLRN